MVYYNYHLNVDGDDEVMLMSIYIYHKDFHNCYHVYSNDDDDDGDDRADHNYYFLFHMVGLTFGLLHLQSLLDSMWLQLYSLNQLMTVNIVQYVAVMSDVNSLSLVWTIVRYLNYVSVDGLFHSLYQNGNVNLILDIKQSNVISYFYN